MDVYHHAVSIVSRLAREGHIAYFAGGWVRDFVMGHPSEDIDIATSATPKEIMELFPKTILVGLAFGVVIVPIAGHQFEVATFRKDLHYADGRHPEAIKLSTSPEDDALRRDFTINGMFYDPLKDLIHDHVHGKEDIQKGIIRAIGNPHERFFEDRLRMLRAFRFAARFSFKIDPETQLAISENAEKLFPAVAMERVWQEFNKMSSYPRFDEAIVEMHRLSLLDVIFPEMEKVHIKDLRRLVASYPHFPKNCPTILYLMELFPSTPINEKIEIAKRLKVKNKDVKALEYYDSLYNSLKRLEEGSSPQPIEWAHLYAHPDCQLCLEVFAAAHYPVENQATFLKKHQQRIDALARHIQRIKEGKPLITAALLQQQGIKPSKKMGILMKEAERIAINEDIHYPELILEKIKQNPLWSDNHG